MSDKALKAIMSAEKRSWEALTKAMSRRDVKLSALQGAYETQRAQILGEWEEAIASIRKAYESDVQKALKEVS